MIYKDIVMKFFLNHNKKQLGVKTKYLLIFVDQYSKKNPTSDIYRFETKYSVKYNNLKYS